MPVSWSSKCLGVGLRKGKFESPAPNAKRFRRRTRRRHPSAPSDVLPGSRHHYDTAMAETVLKARHSSTNGGSS